MFGTARYIVNMHGVGGLYKGLGASLIGIVPFVGINLSLFETLKGHFQPDASDPRFDAYNFGLGAISSVSSVSATYPFELVRRKLQLSGYKDTQRYAGPVDCVRSIVRKRGLAGFYRGFVPCVARVIPAMSISMLVNERLKSSLRALMEED